MRRYFKWDSEGVPFPFVVIENDRVIANVLFGKWWFGRDDGPIGEDYAVTILTDKFAYTNADGCANPNYGWNEVTREQFRDGLKKLGYKKCVGRL